MIVDMVYMREEAMMGKWLLSTLLYLLMGAHFAFAIPGGDVQTVKVGTLNPESIVEIDQCERPPSERPKSCDVQQ
jgi:hypothetical protein